MSAQAHGVDGGRARAQGVVQLPARRGRPLQPRQAAVGLIHGHLDELVAGPRSGGKPLLPAHALRERLLVDAPAEARLWHDPQGPLQCTT